MSNFLKWILFIASVTLVYFLGTLIKPVPPKVVSKIDTLSVVTKEDSIRISNKALIEARAMIATYDLLPDGSWVKRKLKPIYIKGDTVYVDTSKTPGVLASTIDTSMIFLDPVKRTVTQDTISIKFAQTVQAMSLNFKSSLLDGESNSYYKLNLNTSLVDGKWKIKIQEDYNLKKKESTITIEKVVPVYDRSMRPFWDRFSYGPIVAPGWAVFNKSPDMFIGVGFFFDLR